MTFLIVVSAFVVGLAVGILLYHKEITLGQRVLGKFEQDAEKAHAWLSGLPGKIEAKL